MWSTRTRLSDIVHPASSSQLAENPDRVRSFGGYNTNQARTRLRIAKGGRYQLFVQSKKHCFRHCGGELKIYIETAVATAA